MKPGMLLLVAALLAAGCSHDDSDAAYENADVKMLTMGNSHASVNNLQGMLADMVRVAHPGESVAAIEAPGWMFLEDRVLHSPSLSLFRSTTWSFVILQAQKYSTSGCCTYSTAEAEQLIRMARQQGAVPIMFPEWPLRGVDETMRIYDLHVSIAQREPACVAPVGQAWDLSLARHPNLDLYASDGNHSNGSGAFLAALMLFATITGESPLDVPPLTGFGVDPADQALLRVVADDTVQAWPPRTWCPNDPFASVEAAP